jgi:hypothetical protein
MNPKLVLAGILVVFSTSVPYSEARGMGHFGTRGFRHSGASRSGRFGNPGYRAFRPGIYNHKQFGYGYRHFGFSPSVFWFGYFAPDYGFDNYIALEPSNPAAPPVYNGDYNDSQGNYLQPAYGDTFQPDVRPNCNSGNRRADEPRAKSLSGVIRSFFDLQCENRHSNSQMSPPQRSDIKSLGFEEKYPER